ncbi:MAG TPA: glycosyltransferase family 87 protein [Erythrobacter sp.]|nr:glycosyltransferase family 87 protein [Erythrobacter sp.]
MTLMMGVDRHFWDYAGRLRWKRRGRLEGVDAAPLTTSADQKAFSIGLIVLLTLFVLCDATIFSIFKPGSDWAPLWVGGRLSWSNVVQVYDIDLVTALQAPLVGATSDRPFVYPPSALLLFGPMAMLPFTASFMTFGALSVALFGRAAQPFEPRLILLLAAPPVVLAVLAGQPTILVAALILLGLTQLDRREGWAGAAFAVAAMIKPPLLLLAPIALIGGGYWRALTTAGATVVAIGCISLATFGLDAWLAWIAALPSFNALVTGFEPLLRNAVTPYAMAVRLGLLPYFVSACAAIIAIPVVWLSFARTHNASVRLVTLVGGALLISPYAMNYELAALAPVVAGWRLDRVRDLILPVMWAGSLFLTASLAGLLAVYAWAVFKLVSQSAPLTTTNAGVKPWPHAQQQVK